jgi:hypothetical protein
MHYLDGLLARALNSWWGRWESFWAPSSYSRVELVEGRDVIDKVIYTLANPVSSGLVESSSRWPGPVSGVLEGGEERTVYKKPRFFFRPGGTLPEVAVLRVVRPEAERELTDEEFSALLRRRLEEREAECRREMEESGRAFLGAQRVLEESPFDAPRSHEPRRGLNPRVAAKDKWRRIERLQRLASFAEAYRAAWLAFRAGVRDVLFPAGTYWLRRFLGVRCEPLPDTAPT